MAVMNALLIGLSGLAAGIVLAWLWLRAAITAERARTARVPELERALADREAELRMLRDGIEAERLAAVAARERLEAERASAAEKLRLVEEAQAKLPELFRGLSAEALRGNNEAFLELARDVLERHRARGTDEIEARSRAIESLVKPLSESLAQVDARIRELEQSRAQAYGALTEQVSNLAATQRALRDETANLSRALRQPVVRGRWGELTLRRVVEMAGMVEYCDFDLQTTLEREDGRVRPDMMVRLPNGRCIVVDAKAPLQAYLDSLEAGEEQGRRDCLQQHARQIRAHVQKLAARNYWEGLDASPEFVVLFLPGEPFFSAALEADPTLIESAVAERVILATPTTLIALMKAVAYGWQQERLARSAQEISALGRSLHDRLRTLTGHLMDVKKGLDRAVGAFNRAVGSFEGRVLPAARRFRELGAAQGAEIDQLVPVDRATRDLFEALPESRNGTAAGEPPRLRGGPPAADSLT